MTPESVARHIADRLQYERVVDGTCGVGGNAIQRLGWSFVKVMLKLFPKYCVRIMEIQSPGCLGEGIKPTQ